MSCKVACIVFACCVLVPTKLLAVQAAHRTEHSLWSQTRALTESELAALVSREATSKEAQTARIRALLTQSDRAINRSVVDATRYLEEAEALITTQEDASVVALAIRCQLAHRQSLPGAAQTCQQLTQNDRSQDAFVQAFAMTTRMYYLYREGSHQESINAAEHALSLAMVVDDPALIASAHNMMGLYFSTRLRPRMSVPHYEIALEQASRVPYAELKTITQLNLASSYNYLGRSREALTMLYESRGSQVVQIYPTRRLVVQSMIGQVRAALGETDGAEENLQRVIDEVGETVLPDGMTYGYTGLGVIQLAENRPLEALDNFDMVLALSGKSLETDLDYSRIQLMAVPYARALRMADRLAEARDLVLRIIASVPGDQPDQQLLDAYLELAVTLEALGDSEGAKAANEEATRVESTLWDASFKYQVERLSVSLESDRRALELARAQEREVALLSLAQRESRLRRQTWIIGAMIIAVIALFFSRRAQKRIADAQRSASLALEDQVRERTREMEDEMALRMTAEVDRIKLTERVMEGEKLRAMGQLTAGVAHDFNNLMTVVTLGANQLKDDLLPVENPDRAETIDNIRQAAETGAKITRGLLAYVREQPLNPEYLNLDEFLRESTALFRNTIGERIVLDVEAAPCSVLVDKAQLTTALLNVLLNAREAMPEGGRITLTLSAFGDQARIQIRDNGVGMAPHVLEQATEPFFTTKQHEEGSGLGLSMVFGFARQSNGDLHIESALGGGTTVTFFLPMAEARTASASDVSTASSNVPRAVRILAVDDRPSVLRVLKRSLSRMVDTVICATNATEALAMIEQQGLPDCVVTDIVMPGEIDGVGLVRTLRQRSPSLPAVLMSGYARDIDDECVYLQKPFSYDQLERAIEEALSREVESVPAHANG
ncbi:MAG: ATP-binding protein [Pseudomonadota bacterium]